MQRRLPAGKTLTEHHADMVRRLWSQFIPRISRRQFFSTAAFTAGEVVDSEAVEGAGSSRAAVDIFGSGWVGGSLTTRGYSWLSIPGVDAGVDDAFAVRIPIDQADDARLSGKHEEPPADRAGLRR